MFFLKLIQFLFMIFVGYMCYVILRSLFSSGGGKGKNTRGRKIDRSGEKSDHTIELDKDEYKIE